RSSDVCSSDLDMSSRIYFAIPSAWKKKLSIKQGNKTKLCIKNNSIVINACNQYTTEIVNTIGREGQIYIPAEVRRHFDIKGIKRFEVFIDEINKRIILKPNLN